MFTALHDGNLQPRRRTVMSVFGVAPRRIGGTEMCARELSAQLAEYNYNSVLCFLNEPTPLVKNFLHLPNVTFEALPDSTHGRWRARENLLRLAKKHRPDILHLHFLSFLNLYSWEARLNLVPQVFFT